MITKVLKIIANCIFSVVEILLLLLIFFVLAIRTSPVQTFLASKATAFLSKELGTTISIEKLDIVFIDRVDLKGTLVLNKNQNDTIVSLKSLLVNVDGFSQFANKIHLGSVLLEEGVVKIEKEKENGELNLQFIIDYFSSDKPKSNNAIPVLIDKAELKNVRFHYDNHLEEPVNEGMDYQHLLLSNLNLKLKNFSYKNEVILAQINHLSTNEKSGLRLQNFNAKIKVSSKGIELKNVNITTPFTNLNSKKFKLLYNNYSQFSYFVDSVAFDADLHNSTVSFSDISIFAPQLIGMDQQVFIEGYFTKYIKNLKAENFILKTGERTEIRGTVNLPDFRQLEQSFYQERIEYAFVDLEDLQRFKLPGGKPIQLDETVNRLSFFQAHNLKLDGIFSQFVLSSNEIKTEIGSVNLDNGILFTYNKLNNSFLFSKSEDSSYDVKVNQFELGKFLNNSTFGIVDGTFYLSGEAFSFSHINFENIEGEVNQFDLSDYSYSQIKIKNTSFKDNILYAEMDVDDKNLNLSYSGTIDLNGEEPQMNMGVDITKAFLGKLKITENDSTNFIARGQINTIGVNPNTLKGNIELTGIFYTEGNKKINVPKISLDINRGNEVDHFLLESSILKADLKGKVDFNNIGDILQDQLSHILPGLIKLKKDKKTLHKIKNAEDCLMFSLELLDVNELLNIFAPKLYISPNSTISGDYDASKRFFEMDLKSNKVIFDGKKIEGINIKQYADSSSIVADYKFSSLGINDSITLENVRFEAKGNGGNLVSILTWNPETENASNIQWRTTIESVSKLKFVFEPSYFAINTHKWDIEKEAVIAIDSNAIDISMLKLSSGHQFIDINGNVSTNDSDKLNFQINEVDLNKLGQMLGLNIELAGNVNGWGYISNPYNNFTYMGDMNIKGLYINREEVGDVFVMSQWDIAKNMIDLSGDLVYKGIPTFQFKGNYDVSKEKDNIDFKLVFDQTNIAFANAFMDPLVIDNIKGFINGQLDVKGSISRPIIEGTVKLDNASAKIVMLGTHFSFNGPMYADKDGFYIDYMPISDAEGNTGALTGSIYHQDYSNWNFDVAINIEEDYYKRDPIRNWVKMPLDRFLLMNTDGKNGDLYYGKAYGTGTIGIFGYLNNLEINVNVKTQRGSWIDLNLFAQSELSEDNFIEFISHDSTKIVEERKIDFTGVTLNLNFDVTSDAQIKIIFNEQTGDEITAFGDGKIRLRLDNIGQMTLNGTYIVREGSKYNFVLGPIKETFYISDGGSITWTGNPYQATLNLQAYNRVRANLGDLSPELLVSGIQDINCYLKLSESLMKPTIDFDIKAPKAPESDKTLLSQLTSEKDELNRQFFSLLLWKKFQPMKGSSRATGGAALDMASNQINSLLSQVSNEYKLNVDMNADNLGSQYALGVEKGFLDDQLIISGSFGTRNSNYGEASTSSLIGDIEIEYKLNKDGTFRINMFNESNDNRTLQSQNRGQFKQGIGIYYKESFNTFRDFRVLQQTLDMFRNKENKRYPIRRKKQQTPIPKADALPVKED